MSDFVELELHASGAETVDGNGAGEVVKSVGPIAYVLDVTAQSGTTPTLDVDIQGFDPISNKWLVLSSFTQVGAATGSEVLQVSDLAFTRIRAAWALTGGTPSYTFTVSALAKPRY